MVDRHHLAFRFHHSGLVEFGDEGRGFLVDARLRDILALVVVTRIYFLRAFGVPLPSIVPARPPRLEHAHEREGR